MSRLPNPCEVLVRNLAETGVTEDRCNTLKKLVAEGSALEVCAHLSEWVKCIAKDTLLHWDDWAAMQIVPPEDSWHPEDWHARRSDIDKFRYEGWRQHWLQLWGFVGQQVVADARYVLLAGAIADRVPEENRDRYREKLLCLSTFT